MAVKRAACHVTLASLSPPPTETFDATLPRPLRRRRFQPAGGNKFAASLYPPKAGPGRNIQSGNLIDRITTMNCLSAGLLSSGMSSQCMAVWACRHGFTTCSVPSAQTRTTWQKCVPQVTRQSPSQPSQPPQRSHSAGRSNSYVRSASRPFAVTVFINRQRLPELALLLEGRRDDSPLLETWPMSQQFG